MIHVNNTSQKTFSLPGNIAISLAPGENHVPLKAWDRAGASKILRALVESGVLVVRETVAPQAPTVIVPPPPPVPPMELPNPTAKAMGGFTAAFTAPGDGIPDSGKGYVDPSSAGARAESNVSKRENRFFLDDVEVSAAEYMRRTDPRTPVEALPALTPPPPSGKRRVRHG